MAQWKANGCCWNKLSAESKENGEVKQNSSSSFHLTNQGRVIVLISKLFLTANLKESCESWIHECDADKINKSAHTTLFKLE